MKVKDKDQDRLVKVNALDGKKKKLLDKLTPVFLIIGALLLFFGSNSTLFTGTPYLVVVGGFEG